MKLLIDSGNSRLKWKLHNGHNWLDEDAGILYQPLSEETVALTSLDPALAYCHDIWVANVAGASVQKHLERLAHHHKKPIHFIQATYRAHDLTNHYDPPHLLGSDRYAALVGAVQWLKSNPQHTILINCGTAITLEYLRQDGHFCGGLIIPGLQIMQHALVSATAQLDTQDGHWHMMPNNTANAMATGIMQAAIGAIEKTIEMWSTYGKENAKGSIAQILLTGGYADQLAKHLSHPVQISHNLVLEGLLIMANNATIPLEGPHATLTKTATDPLT